MTSPHDGAAERRRQGIVSRIDTELRQRGLAFVIEDDLVRVEGRHIMTLNAFETNFEATLTSLCRLLLQPEASQTASRPILHGLDVQSDKVEFAIPKGSHAGRSIACLQVALQNPVLRSRLASTPGLVAQLVSFLDTAFDAPYVADSLPPMVIQVVIDYLNGTVPTPSE